MRKREDIRDGGGGDEGTTRNEKTRGKIEGARERDGSEEGEGEGEEEGRRRAC